MNDEFSDIRASYIAHGQDHVLDFIDRLDAAERRAFHARLAAVDLDLLDGLARRTDESQPPPVQDAYSHFGQWSTMHLHRPQ